MPERTSPFRSFFAGGFECATHRRPDRQQIDVIHRTRHDVLAETDYRLLQQVGIATVRDGLRWHRIEQQPGVYDWSSFLPMLQASISTGTQVIWDLCHWGLPHDIDIFSPAFSDRFAAYARAAALLIRAHTDTVPFFHAIRGVSPAARFIQPEPIINIAADPNKPEESVAADRHTAAQYEAWDWLQAGNSETESGLDIIGINYYWNNQWIHQGERASLGHLQHRPLHQMILEVWNRYRRPIFISETGAESGAGAGWLGYVSAEIRQALRHGVDLVGLCFYPVMDYPGWDDDRHCGCGLIEISEDWTARQLRPDLVAELRSQQRLFSL